VILDSSLLSVSLIALRKVTEIPELIDCISKLALSEREESEIIFLEIVKLTNGLTDSERFL